MTLEVNHFAENQILACSMQVYPIQKHWIKVQKKKKYFSKLRRLYTLLKFISIDSSDISGSWLEVRSLVVCKLLQTDLIIKLWAAGRVVPSDPRGSKAFYDLLTIRVQIEMCVWTPSSLLVKELKPCHWHVVSVHCCSLLAPPGPFLDSRLPEQPWRYRVLLYWTCHLSTGKCRESEFIWISSYCDCDKETFTLSFVLIFKLLAPLKTAGEQQFVSLTAVLDLLKHSKQAQSFKVRQVQTFASEGVTCGDIFL